MHISLFHVTWVSCWYWFITLGNELDLRIMETLWLSSCGSRRQHTRCAPPPPFATSNMTFLKIFVESHLLGGQTTMYLVSSESSFEMQDNSLCSILVYTVCTCWSLKGRPPPTSKNLGSTTVTGYQTNNGMNSSGICGLTARKTAKLTLKQLSPFSTSFRHCSKHHDNC